MKNVIKQILREYVEEKRKDWIKEHCNVAFKEPYDRNFCYSTTRVFKDNYSFQETIKKYLSIFIKKYENEISTIKWDALTSEHNIAKQGLKELEWVLTQSLEITIF